MTEFSEDESKETKTSSAYSEFKLNIYVNVDSIGRPHDASLMQHSQYKYINK